MLSPVKFDFVPLNSPMFSEWTSYALPYTPYLNLSSGLAYWEVHSIKWITLVWGGYQGDFSLRSTWPRWLCLVNLPHPWGKFSTLLNQFYNPPGWPGVLPLGQADDMCIRDLYFAKRALRRPWRDLTYLVIFLNAFLKYSLPRWWFLNTKQRAKRSESLVSQITDLYFAKRALRWPWRYLTCLFE